MVLILLSWIVMLLFFIPNGMFLKSIIKIETNNLSIITFLGMFLQTIFLCFCCFFTNLGIEIFVANAILVSIITFYKSSEIKIVLAEFKNSFKLNSVFSNIILIIIFISTLFTSSKSPFLIDNESYYIQTIKWINEFGFVKGLANLHIFFAQSSPFHVLQAGFNFSFLTNKLNDLNGFILIISSFFFIHKFEKIYVETNNFHWIGMIPVFNVLFFLFISQPSPDFIIIVVSQIIFYLFIEENQSENALKSSILLFLFLAFVKVTIAPIAILILFWIHKKKRFLNLFIIFGIIISLIFVFKNTIISGYPFYPFKFFSFDFDWKIPENLFLFITESSKNTGYFENEVVLNPTFYQKIYAWLHLSGLNRVFNLGIILLFFLSLFTNEFKKNKNYRILYFILLIHFLVLLLTSPQFRFFLPEFVFFTVLIISNCINYLKINFRVYQILMVLFLVFSIILVEYLDFKKLTNNKYLQQKSSFGLENFIFPKSNSKYINLKFEKNQNENLEYYSPKENFFFFGTGDGILPCVNKVQIDYFEKYYFIKPQLRTDNLKDGFYSKISKPNNE